MRYVWDMYHEYLSGAGRVIRTLFPFVAHWLRVWDRLSADRVDYFIANSKFVANRIRKFYRRDADVIYPPVATHEFTPALERGDFYLCLGQLVSYKRADLAVAAFNELKLPLVVIGEGELSKKLKGMAGPNITLMGRQPFPIIKDHLQRCRGLIFPGQEDFGIVPVEAMAAGAPVIAFAKGGALETVIDGKTGVLFDEQTQESLIAAIQKIETNAITFDPAVLQAHAATFDKSVFKNKMQDFINSKLNL